MEITLYRSRAERTKLDKTSQLTKVATLVGTLRDSTSVTNPTIIVENTFAMDREVVDGDGLIVSAENEKVSIIDLSNPIDCNYMYIKEFNRFYFIDGIVSLNSRLWALNCSVDVLMSFKEEILALNVYVDRNQYDYDSDLIDNEVIVENDVIRDIIEVPSNVFRPNDITASCIMLEVVSVKEPSE